MGGLCAIYGCSGGTGSQAPQRAPVPGPCVDPELDVAAREKVARAQVKGMPSPDVDGGQDQELLILSTLSPASSSSSYSLYLREGGCARLINVITAFSVGCRFRSGEPERTPCDLDVETWLMHGDRKRCRWVYYGGRYSESYQCEEILGPRFRFSSPSPPTGTSFEARP
jgi:hypothetical protein